MDSPDRRDRWLLLLDLILVVAFAASGRASHAEALSVLGLLTTAWPFLVACVLAQLLTRAWRRPAAPWPTGVLIWLVTLVVGMVLRLLTGAGTAPAFVVVATLVLGVFLVVPRVLVTLLRGGATRGAAVPR